MPQTGLPRVVMCVQVSLCLVCVLLTGELWAQANGQVLAGLPTEEVATTVPAAIVSGVSTVSDVALTDPAQVPAADATEVPAPVSSEVGSNLAPVDGSDDTQTVDINYSLTITVENRTTGQVIQQVSEDCSVAAVEVPDNFLTEWSISDYIQAAQECPETFYARFLQAFNKDDAVDEEVHKQRVATWLQNLDVLNTANSGTQPKGLILNSWADETLEQTVGKRSGLPSIESHPRLHRKLKRRKLVPATTIAVSIPEAFHWSDVGMPFTIRNQGECNGCYAFAATQQVENLLWLATGKAYELSIDDIMNCCSTPGCWYGNQGGCENPQSCGPCNTGWPDAVLSWVAEFGLQTEASEPYDPASYLPWNLKLPPTASCAQRESPSSIVAALVNFDEVTDVYRSFTEQELIQALLKNGPVVIAMNNQDDVFRFLGPKHSVASPNNVLAGINHAVLLVGYGVHSSGNKYWLVQNSWGSDWGDGGFARLTRSPEDPWQILVYATQAHLQNGPRCLIANCNKCDMAQLQGMLNCAECKDNFTKFIDAYGRAVCV